MHKRFCNNISVTKIGRIFCHAKFGSRKHCLRCKSRKVYILKDNRLKCSNCGYRFKITTNSVLSKTRLPLDQWYELLHWFNYEFTANKVAKELYVSQRNVHHWFSIIRKAIFEYEEKQIKKFVGTVEADETYVGPKFRNRRKKTRDKYRQVNAVKRGRGAVKIKQPIFGLYQRNGTVYVKFVSDAKKKTLQDIIKGRIVLDSSVYTDTWRSYKGLETVGYRHRTIDHGECEYVSKTDKRVHINGIEGFWGYLKERLLKHHGIARKNLIYYVKESEFRFNNRHLTTDQFIKQLTRISVR